MYLQDFEKTFSAAAAAAGASSSSMDYSYLNQSTFDAAASALTGAMDGGRDLLKWKTENDFAKKKQWIDLNRVIGK